MDHKGFNINQLLESNKCSNFDQDHLLTLIYNILCALNFIHSSGLVHDNLKPENISLDESCFVTLAGMDSIKMPSENDLGISNNDASQSTMENTPMLPKLKCLGISEKILSTNPFKKGSES
jgi:serine/threonine protein kinase